MKTIKNNISDKDRKIFIVFLAFLIIAGSYQFAYRGFSKKTRAFETENALLADTLAELKRKSNSKEEYSNRIADMENQIAAIREDYPQYITQEKITQFVIELEEVADMKVSSITFQNVADIVPEYADSSVTNTNEASAEKPSTYTTVITLSYMTTYEGLKQAIDYINEYDDYRNIRDLTAAFDSSTGNLSGTMTICIYTLNPLGSEYVKPEFQQPTGNQNIFGSFELPVE